MFPSFPNSLQIEAAQGSVCPSLREGSPLSCVRWHTFTLQKIASFSKKEISFGLYGALGLKSLSSLFITLPRGSAHGSPIPCPRKVSVAGLSLFKNSYKTLTPLYLCLVKTLWVQGVWTILYQSCREGLVSSQKWIRFLRICSPWRNLKKSFFSNLNQSPDFVHLELHTGPFPRNPPLTCLALLFPVIMLAYTTDLYWYLIILVLNIMITLWPVIVVILKDVWSLGSLVEQLLNSQGSILLLKRADSLRLPS